MSKPPKKETPAERLTTLNQTRLHVKMLKRRVRTLALANNQLNQRLKMQNSKVLLLLEQLAELKATLAEGGFDVIFSEVDACGDIAHSG